MITWLSPDSDEKADIAVITVPWNVKELLLEGLRALECSRGTVKARCIVVDNASKDGVVEAVRQEFPWVHVIANDWNAGFSFANTQGLLQAHARHALLLNPDMRVEATTIQSTVEYLDAHPEAGVVGVHLVDAKGATVPHVRRFPTLWSQLVIALKLGRLFPHAIDDYLRKNFDYTQEADVDSVRGSFFAMHEQAILRCGSLDTRYFLWFEEVDYCKQVQTRGLKVRYTPTIHALDYVGQSFRKRSTWHKQKIIARSMIQYFEKWHPWWQAWVLRIAWGIVLSGMYLFEILGIASLYDSWSKRAQGASAIKN